MRANNLPAEQLGIFTLMSKTVAFSPSRANERKGRDAFSTPTEPAGSGLLAGLVKWFVAGDPHAVDTTTASAPAEPVLQTRLGHRFDYALNRESRWAMIACGLWLRAVFIGAAVSAVGVNFLFTGEMNALPAIALALGGALFVPYAMRRTWAVVDRSEASTAV